MSKILVDEDALEKLDDYIYTCYSQKLWWKFLGGFELECSKDTCSHLYQAALNNAVEAKKLAKAFGLYPYNQPIVNNP